MSYYRYYGVRIVDGKRKKGESHTSYSFHQTAFQGAYRELKKGWDYLVLEHMSNYANVFYEYYVLFVDKDGMFGKKNGVIMVKSKDAKGSLSKSSIYKNGEYLDSNGLTHSIKRVYRKKNKDKDPEFGVPDGWHPFYL